MIIVQEVQNKKQLKDFIKVPNILYQSDPYYRAQLSIERLEHLSHKNPYFEHATHVFFVAYEDQKLVGRISVQIDKLSQKENEPCLAHFGFLDAANKNVLESLLADAEKWAIEKGAQKISGPYSLSINDEAGLLIEGFNNAPSMMMNYAPKWLGPALEQHAYSKAKDLLAFTMRTDCNIPLAAQRIADKVVTDSDIAIRTLNKKNMERDLTTILDIFNDAWADNWGFIPMTKEEISYVAKNMKPLIQPDLVQIVETNNKPAAMIVALPDLNEALDGLNGNLFPFNWIKLLWRLKIKRVNRARVLLMGVRNEFQKGFLGSTLAITLVICLHKNMRTHGYKEAELSWILEDNAPMIRLIESAGGHVYKRYRIYEKDI